MPVKTIFFKVPTKLVWRPVSQDAEVGKVPVPGEQNDPDPEEYEVSLSEECPRDDVLTPDVFSGNISTSTLVQKLEAEYGRCMCLTTEELDLNTTVYTREGSDLMFCLRDELAMLPELKTLSPRCNIDEADVGVPGKPTPEIDATLKKVLKISHKMLVVHRHEELSVT
ncbi:unnamed protein product [Phytophthora fragariaefolia]|uniref:Unnamed protein product n=1 Tax=Phytophthora fragariaefolia TaxID=1490495 RepID=A0A9W7CX90_9STRA|nr:unnamed protein product [Phytophthora fragariaefolia]